MTARLAGRYGLFILFCASFYLLIRETDKATNTEELFPTIDGMLIAAIFFIVMGLFTAVAARNKGRDHIGWFAWGTLFCFVVLPLAVMIEPKNPKSGMKSYPKCVKLIEDRANYCQYCGTNVGLRR